MQKASFLKYMNISHQPTVVQLTIDIKHRPDTLLVDIFYTSKNDKLQSRKCQNCIHFL